jgi:poly(hydroxyalkanoate) depolymerase family esterase
MTRSLTRWFVVALLACAGSLPALAGTTSDFTLSAQSYSGSRERQYKVYVPDGLTGPAPMLMALHGCQQTHNDVLRDWGLVAAADRYRFILVAPFITSYDGLRNTNCWGFWLDQHRHQGRGEPEDLHQIARQVEVRYSIDPQRRYVTGLSSGGAMAAILSVTHNEYFAAVASASGLPYGEDAASVSFSGCPGSATFHAVSQVVADMRRERNAAYAIPLMVLQNNRDCTVIQPAGRNLRDAQLLLNGDAAHDTPAEAQAVQRACTPVFGADYACQQTIYTVDGRPGSRSLVETVFYDGPAATPDTSDTDHGHYWIGGQNGRDGRWALQRGPSYPDIVWDFFSRHATGAAPPPTGSAPVVTLLGPNPLSLVRGQAFSDPGASAQDAEDGSLPVQADCSSVNINQVGNYSCTYRATDSAGNTASATRGVIVSDTPAPACRSVNAAPGAHVAAGRAVAGGSFSLRAVTTGDAREIGYVWDYYLTRVNLYEGAGARWFAQPPLGCSP